MNQGEELDYPGKPLDPIGWASHVNMQQQNFA